LLLTLAAFAAPALSPRSDPDVWWHLKAGTEFISGGPLPFRDTWSCTTPGHPWINHEWLAEVCFASARRAAGEGGVVLLAAAIAAIAAGLIVRAALREGLPAWLIAFLSCLAALAITDRLLPRPQLFTYLFFALFLERIGAMRHGASPWALPIIQIFWTNLHGPWIGLAAGSLLLLGGGVPTLSWKRRWFLIALVGLASLAHPQAYRVLIEPLANVFRGDVYHQTIQEWQPIQRLLPRVIPQAPATALLMMAGALAAILAFLTRRGRRMWGYPVLLLALSLAPLLSNRHRDLVAVAFVPVLAVLFGDRLSRVSGRWVAALCSGLAIVFLLVPEAGWLGYPSAWPWTLRLSRANCPEAAVAFLNKEDIGSRMFNAYDYGGFLVDQVHRKRLDFIDGRLLVDERVYEEYLDVRDGGDGAQSILDRYHIDLLVIRYPQPGGYQNLAREARDWPEWALVFWDDTTLIYARRDRVEGGWLAAHAYRWLDPTLPSPMRARAYWVDHYGDLIREAERAALDAPLAARPVLSLALAHEYNGHIDAAARDYRRVLEMHPENRPAREGLNRVNDARR